jgi:phage-related protein
MSVLFVNDVDLDALGYGVLSVAGWGAALNTDVAYEPAPGRSGVLLGEDTTQERLVELSMHVPAGTIAARDAALGFITALFTGAVELRFSDSPHKMMRGIVTSVRSRAEAEGVSFVDPSLVIDVTVMCPNPAKIDRYLQVATIGAQALPVPTGNLPHGGVIVIQGAATNPVITYARGVNTLGFTVTLGATDKLEIDLDTMSVTRYTAGVASNGNATWTSGEFFVFDPRDTTTLSLSSGTGALYYRRHWSN